MTLKWEFHLMEKTRSVLMITLPIQTWWILLKIQSDTELRWFKSVWLQPLTNKRQAEKCYDHYFMLRWRVAYISLLRGKCDSQTHFQWYVQCTWKFFLYPSSDWHLWKMRSLWYPKGSLGTIAYAVKADYKNVGKKSQLEHLNSMWNSDCTRFYRSNLSGEFKQKK